jgi:protein-tyrosine phosphatase
MRAVIDLHCHILPGLDDGAVDLDDSVAMARQAAADRIAAICATPHIRHDHDVLTEEIGARVAELNAELDRRRVPVSVHAGGEVAETIVERLDEDELRQVALGDGSWILLEPAPGPLSESLEARVEYLAARGHRCLIAHPERHFADDLAERLARVVAAGALVQATAAHLLQEETVPLMLELAGRGLIHVLGSDAHSSRFGRPAEISPALRALREVEPIASHLDWVARTGPRAIVAGGEVEPPFGSL